MVHLLGAQHPVHCSARLLTVVTAVGDMLALFRADLVPDVMAFFEASLEDLSPTFFMADDAGHS